MTEVPSVRYKCEGCGRVHAMADKALECEARHAAETEVCTIGRTVTIDIGHSEPVYMGGPGLYVSEYATGVVVKTRKGRDGPDALVEYKGERNWVPAWSLVRAAQEHAAIEYRKAHPIDYSAMSHCTVIQTIAATSELQQRETP